MERTIKNRQSIRQFIKNKDIPEEIITSILEAGMSAPSGCGRYPVRYMLINDPQNIEKISTLSGKQPILTSSLNILVLADTDSSIGNPAWSNLWNQDCAASMENMLLEAHLKGLGGVWGGIYGRQEYVDFISELLNLPKNLIPFGIAIIGYPEKNITLTEAKLNQDWIIEEK